MRRSLVIAAVLCGLALALVAGPSLLFSPTSEEVAPATEDDPEIVDLEGSESGFWPYLSAREAHDKRSPINLVVRGNATEIVRLLSEESAGDWDETDHDHFEEDGWTDPVDPATNESPAQNLSLDGLATELAWTQAAGTTRYAYHDPGPDGERFWTTETLQLEDGDYYGQRYHIRLYESPNAGDEWVAMQAHTEHFDWFTLRHRVDGVEAAQSRTETDLMSIPAVDDREDVQRINLGNRGPSDADGWATKVDLRTAAVVPLVVGLVAKGRRSEHLQGTRERVESHLTEADRRRLAAAADRVDPRHLLLAATVFGLLFGVRLAGIVLEHRAGFLSMHAIAALLYPVIAIGIPAATYAIATGLRRRLDAAVVASTSFAVAIWFDYGFLGVDRLAVDVVVQRMLVIVALGLIAAGAANRATRTRRLNELFVVGLTLWTLVLVGTLFGYL